MKMVGNCCSILRIALWCSKKAKKKKKRERATAHMNRREVEDRQRVRETNTEIQRQRDRKTETEAETKTETVFSHTRSHDQNSPCSERQRAGFHLLHLEHSAEWHMDDAVVIAAAESERERDKEVLTSP